MKETKSARKKNHIQMTVCYNLTAEEKLEDAFHFGVLEAIVLETIKALIWEIEEKLKEKDKGVVG